MWIRFYIEKKSASMLPEGNGSCYYIEKKWPRMPPEGNAFIENGKRQFFVLRKIMVSILRPFPYRKNIEKM